MKIKKALLAIALSACGSVLLAQSPEMQPDNTRQNQVDRDRASQTADQQPNDRTDVELARQVRQVLVKDKALSTYAHNVKVIAQNGDVTLRGPVRSDEEKQVVESKAAEVAGGADHVHSELQVAQKPN